MKLIDVRTADGSRHFACLPRTATWQALCDHLALLPGAEVSFVTSGVAGGWLDFSYRGHRFYIRQHGDDLCFLVRDPRCSDLRLYQVAAYFEGLLGSTPE